MAIRIRIGEFLQCRFLILLKNYLRLETGEEGGASPSPTEPVRNFLGLEDGEWRVPEIPRPGRV